MTDIHGIEYMGNTVLFIKKPAQQIINWFIPSSQQRNTVLMIEVSEAHQWDFEIISMNGTIVKKGLLDLHSGKNVLQIIPDAIAEGIYTILVIDETGEKHVLVFKKI
jgi:hypothetical protein